MKSKFRLFSASCQVTWVRFHTNYISISNFSFRKAQQLASKIVATLSQQNISLASDFEDSILELSS